MKLTIIGGGSSYTPELMDGLIDRAPAIGLTEVVLHDLDDQRLEIVTGFVRRMAEAKGSNLKIETTTDLDEAVVAAYFIVAQIRVGGMKARQEDELLGMRHGLVGQETTGVGGFAKALRTIPAMLEIGKVIEARSPAAVLINFTNPSGMVTEAMTKHSGVTTIGLCNIPLTFQIELAKVLDAQPDEVDLDYVGLNHLSWIRRVSLRGEDVTKRVMAMADPDARPANVPVQQMAINHRRPANARTQRE